MDKVKTNMCLWKVTNEIVDHKLIPHIAGHGVKKLLVNMPIKWKAYLNKIMCGHDYE